MLHSGDIHLADLGEPAGSEAGFTRPVAVVTAQLVLDHGPRVVHVVPLTSTIRQYQTEIMIEPDATNGLEHASSAQCQHVRVISRNRLSEPTGNIGVQALRQIRETLADLFDL